MVQLRGEHDQCSRCGERISTHEPVYTEWEDIEGLSVCPDCISPEEWAGFGRAIHETRCSRCGSRIFAETDDGLADVPVGSADGRVLCEACADPNGRIAGVGS